MRMRFCHKKALICVMIAAFTLLFYTFSFAQHEGIKGVQFKDGSAIYGRVIKMSADDIQIETKDGKIISRKFTDVEGFIITENLRGIRLKDGSVMYGKITEMDFNKVIILTKDNNTVTKKFDDVASFIKKDGEEKKPSKRFFTLGTEISYIKYKETYMEDKGMMYGIAGSYAYHGNVMLKVEGKFAYGRLDYEGQTWGGTPLAASAIPAYMLELRGLLGYDFIVKAITITPNLGFGYRWLQDNSQNVSPPGGYKRESNYFYIPVGVETVANLGYGWSLGANVEYDRFLWGTQNTYLSNVDPGFNDVENKQTSGYGFRGSISVAKKYEKIGFVIEPYIRYWNINDSEIEPLTYYGTPVLYAIEPSNNSTEIGCKLAITF